MRRPRISILLPVRDAASTLAPCLRSLQRQRLTEWECLLVDDGSRDASLAIAEEVARRDPRIRVLPRPARGIVASLNDAIAHAHAPIVARMDADDLMHRHRLAAQASALEADATLGAVGCRVRIFPRSGLSDGMRAYEAWLNALDTPEAVERDAFVECPVAHPTLAIRTPLLRELGYRDLPWPEDYDLLLRLIGSGVRVTNVARRLLCWRDGPERLSRVDPRYALSAFTACKAEHLANGILKGHDDYVLWGYGATGRALARALEAHGRRPRAIVEVHPRRIGKRIRGAPVIPPESLTRARDLPLVASVSGATARGKIRAHLSMLGARETRDYVVAA